MGADGGHSDTGSRRLEPRTEIGETRACYAMMCHGFTYFVGFCVCWRPFLGRLFGVSFTGALASFNDKFVVQQQTTPLKNPDNMAP